MQKTENCELSMCMAKESRTVAIVRKICTLRQLSIPLPGALGVSFSRAPRAFASLGALARALVTLVSAII